MGRDRQANRTWFGDDPAQGVKAALEHMPAGSVPPVEPAAIADIEPADDVAQVGQRRAHQQVIMVVHEHKRVEFQQGGA